MTGLVHYVGRKLDPAVLVNPVDDRVVILASVCFIQSEFVQVLGRNQSQIRVAQQLVSEVVHAMLDVDGLKHRFVFGHYILPHIILNGDQRASRHESG